MKDHEIENFAHELANQLPAQPPEADRVRRRFVVDRIWAEGQRYRALRVHVDDAEFLASHTRPGQYLTFQCGSEDPRFLVIANAPGADEEHWEFLIDLDSDLGETIEQLREGHHVCLSPAEGAGYPADDLAGASVLIFTTGAGVASVRPVLQYWRLDPDRAPANVAVYYGESERDDFAYVQEFADWRAHGARVFQAIENLPEPEEGYRYVQHAFDAHDPELEDALVFVSGAPVMMELVIGKLLRLGVAPEHIHLNV
ncbi:hypothetical protein FIV42_13750 [Persicimonas caeni]|uniref:FAD-binding FR-type domain-containing protein n=1 Tax=Persicimonas caeni TaxID=2292766 RepID=A0A4Y6PTX5_PERCE|nr:hypothetical protein [Persicimonas caeni]QDG51772.1 hypothetical protein FIV42_13750 [Persicimonas caeni]QED32993.1 hypothetical protein FRD00_13745 [Persicimonas caeni]